MKTKRNPAELHPPFSAYSHQIELRGESRMLVLSGQIGVDQQGVAANSRSAQLQQAWRNVGDNLAAAGMTYQDIVKLTIYLVGDVDAGERRQLLGELLGELKPCMTVLYVTALGDPSLTVELDVWASAE